MGLSREGSGGGEEEGTEVSSVAGQEVGEGSM